MDNRKPKLGNVREVAEELHCSVATVWRAVAADKLPQPIRIGGRTLWNMREIEALIDAKLAERDNAEAA